MKPLSLALVVLVVLAVAGCGSDDPDEPSGARSETATASEQRFPDVVDVRIERDGELYDVSVTLSSPYDSPERYADAWRVVAPDGTVLGERVLAHDHASEQPFTRSLDDVEIPPDVEVVTVQGRDLVNGYGGGDAMVAVPGRG